MYSTMCVSCCTPISFRVTSVCVVLRNVIWVVARPVDVTPLIWTTVHARLRRGRTWHPRITYISLYLRNQHTESAIRWLFCFLTLIRTTWWLCESCVIILDKDNCFCEMKIWLVLSGANHFLWKRVWTWVMLVIIFQNSWMYAVKIDNVIFRMKILVHYMFETLK